MAIQPVIPFDAIPLLASFRPADRAALEPYCRLRGYEKGETIFDEGVPADRIYFVVHGRVKIVKAAGTRDLILEILGGTTLETAIRLMSRWQKEGVILTEKEGFLIADAAALQNLSAV